MQLSAAQPAAPARQITSLGFRKIDPAALSTAGLSSADAEHVISIANQVYAQYQQQKDLVSSFELQIRRMLTTELHPYAYDSYLYAIGQRNRLEVIGFSSGSVAQEYGMAAGDLIDTLNGQRIYSQGDLQDFQLSLNPGPASTNQDPEDLAEVRILRRGQPLSFYLPANYLGLQLASRRINPATIADTLYSGR